MTARARASRRSKNRIIIIVRKTQRAHEARYQNHKSCPSLICPLSLGPLSLGPLSLGPLGLGSLALGPLGLGPLNLGPFDLASPIIKYCTGGPRLLLFLEGYLPHILRPLPWQRPHRLAALHIHGLAGIIVPLS